MTLRDLGRWVFTSRAGLIKELKTPKVLRYFNNPKEYKGTFRDLFEYIHILGGRGRKNNGSRI